MCTIDSSEMWLALYTFIFHLESSIANDTFFKVQPFHNQGGMFSLL